jgi:P27 family predicted phage terminase small subunit
MATRGRKPKPTHLKLVMGNPGGRKLNDAEAKVAADMPEPPRELGYDALAEWDRVSAELFRAGLLSSVDRAALAAYCDAYGIWAQACLVLDEMADGDGAYRGLLITTDNGNLIQNPVVGVRNKARADMVRFAAEFGMTPSARSRITASPPREEEDPAAKYFA